MSLQVEKLEKNMAKLTIEVSADDFEKIGPWIEGGSNYFLQNFVASERVLHPGFSGYTKDELRQFAEIMVPFVGHVALRGVD